VSVHQRPEGDLTPTPGHTIGPFFGFALPFERDSELADRGAPGAIRLHGTVTDGHGSRVPDALLEIWQADADGTIPSATGSLLRDRHTFTGWGRASVDGEGHYTFTTVDPGVTAEGHAPFISLVVFARGLTHKLHTRIYLPDDAAALAADPLLRSLPDDERATLVATREPNGDLRFDIRLQGEGETVFLTYPRHRP
jgi:protocatechuate 3,4-dioxygenase, alpha subunit